MEHGIKDLLDNREREGTLRCLTNLSPSGNGRVRTGGREYINFSSNDYLGLSNHPAVIEAAKESLSPVCGASASRLMTGSTELHLELEKKTAVFKNKPAALVFNSGYQANIGIISTLCGKDDCVFSDRLNHASIVDGISLSGAKLFRFKHNDTEHLEELLLRERAKYKHALIITETVFSMDGDIAPLEDITALKERYDCQLMVDEAHATGIFGAEGSGMVEQKGLSARVDIIMGTFSKGLGSFGAYAASSEIIRDYLLNFCRSFIYSTALPPSIIAANIAAIEIISSEPERRNILLENAAYFRNKLRNNGFDVIGDSQIIPIITGENDKTVRMSELLKKKGYWVTPVRPPTVPKGRSRLRISLTFDHKREILDRFAGDMAGI